MINSIAENKGITGFTAYSASKAAVRSFVRTWTAELKDRCIRVNAIRTGPIDTPIFEQRTPTKEGARPSVRARLGKSRGEQSESACSQAADASNDPTEGPGRATQADGGRRHHRSSVSPRGRPS